MWWLNELLCAGLERSVSSILPWDIPWYDPSHVVFFSALYAALGVIGLGLLAALLLTLLRMKSEEEEEAHH
jgi:hypothetical protein